MNDPKRLLLTVDANSPTANLLRVATPPRPMTDAERGRSARRIARIAAFPLLSAFLLSIKSVAMATVLGAAVGMVFISAVHVMRSTDNSQPPQQAAYSPPIAASPTASTTLQVAEPVVAPLASEQEPRKAELPPVATDSIAQEAAILEQARVKLSSDASSALALLQQSAAKYPHGKLTMEREFLLIDALRRLGRNAEARRRAQALIEASPDGLYAKQLRQLIDLSPADASSNDDFLKGSPPKAQ